MWILPKQLINSMWILPKQLITSASALAMKESEADSQEFSQLCATSLTWRGKDSQPRTWLRRWKREPWLQHLSIRTLRPSRSQSFVDAWTSSLVDSRANPSALPENVRALKIPDISSRISPRESDSANHQLSFSKTSKEFLAAEQEMVNPFSNMSCEHWKEWVTEQRREYSVRLKLAHHTRESVSTSWGTPNTIDHMRLQAWRTASAKLRANWPTATTRDWKDSISTVPPSRANPSKQTLGQRVAHVGLLDQAKSSTTGKSRELQWPTPRANKVQPKITEENRAYLANRKKANLEEEIAGHCGKAVGQLNPDWVESLMGLPTGWTDFAFSEME